MLHYDIRKIIKNVFNSYDPIKITLVNFMESSIELIEKAHFSVITTCSYNCIEWTKWALLEKKHTLH